MVKIKHIRGLFDLGVQITFGDDEIDIIGRDFNEENESSYIETIYSFSSDADLADIYNYIENIKRT